MARDSFYLDWKRKRKNSPSLLGAVSQPSPFQVYNFSGLNQKPKIRRRRK